MKRQLSTSALAAKQIRAHLKKHGIAAKVRSDNYSMGSSVNVTITDELPATVRLVKSFCSQYQAGSFDGMTDMYTYDNKNDSLPQAKYVSVDCQYSNEMYLSAWEYARGYFAGFYDLPKSFNDATYIQPDRWNDNVGTIVYRILSGAQECGFWSTFKPHVKAA